MYVVFLTGGIGSGKSTVARLLHDRGAQLIDLDDIAHEVLDDSSVKRELAERFGEDILEWPDDFQMYWAADQVHAVADGVEDHTEWPLDVQEGLSSEMLAYATIRRSVLARKAFASDEGTRDLNAITHPRITERLGAALTSVSCTGGTPAVTVVEVQLIERIGEARVLADQILTICAPLELRRERAIARGMDPQDFDARNAQQPSDEDRMRLADSCIVNDGDPDLLCSRVQAWWDTHITDEHHQD